MLCLAAIVEIKIFVSIMARVHLSCVQDAQRKAKEDDKRRNAAAAAKAEAAAKAKENAKGANKNKAEKVAAKDPDPDGAELASTSTPLEEAAKLLVPLREHAGSRLKTHCLSFEVASLF